MLLTFLFGQADKKLSLDWTRNVTSYKTKPENWWREHSKKTQNDEEEEKNLQICAKKIAFNRVSSWELKDDSSI